jgi:hypothetical protein
VLDEFHLDLPEDATILSFAEQKGEPVVWVALQPDKPMVRRYFRLAGTGHTVNVRPGQKLAYIGTAQFDSGSFVLHLFEFPPPTA